MMRKSVRLPKRNLAFAALLVIAGSGCPHPMSARASADAPPAPSLFRVGETGILCYMEPCPRRGIIPLGAEDAVPQRPIWSGDRPPELRAGEAEQRRIASTWEENGCLIVEGTFVEGVLAVRRIHGPC